MLQGRLALIFPAGPHPPQLPWHLYPSYLPRVVISDAHLLGCFPKSMFKLDGKGNH